MSCYSFIFALSSFCNLQAIAAFQVALQHNPQNMEISKKIKRLTQLAREKKRVLEVQSIRSSVNMAKFLEPLKPEFVSSWHLFFFFFYKIKWHPYICFMFHWLTCTNFFCLCLFSLLLFPNCSSNAKCNMCICITKQWGVQYSRRTTVSPICKSLWSHGSGKTCNNVTWRYFLFYFNPIFLLK